VRTARRSLGPAGEELITRCKACCKAVCLDAAGYLRARFEMNSTLVENDLAGRVLERRRGLEAELRTLLARVVVGAEAALALAQSVRSSGASAVEANLLSLEAAGEVIQTLLSTSSPSVTGSWTTEGREDAYRRQIFSPRPGSSAALSRQGRWHSPCAIASSPAGPGGGVRRKPSSLAATNDSCWPPRASGSFVVFGGGGAVLQTCTSSGDRALSHSDQVSPSSESARPGTQPTADPSEADAETTRRPRVSGQTVPPAWLTRVRAHWKRRIAWHVIAGSTVATAALLLFAKVGEDVFEHESGSFDAAVRSWMLARQTRPLFHVFTWITNAGSIPPIVAMTLVVCLWLWRAKGRHAAAGALLSPIVAVTLYVGVKLFYGRIRPLGALHFHLLTYSFPSGHATVSMTAAVTAAYVLWREGFLGRRTALAIGFLIPVLVGFSRTYLDVHWATDVLGGWSVGLFVASVAVVIYERLRHDPDVVNAEGVTSEGPTADPGPEVTR
jgi:membrane-associated phospholipid phosphatase